MVSDEGLINVADSVLVVVDVQAPFLDKLDNGVAAGSWIELPG
jgi:hypothetical protein